MLKGEGVRVLTEEEQRKEFRIAHFELLKLRTRADFVVVPFVQAGAGPPIQPVHIES